MARDILGTVSRLKSTGRNVYPYTNSWSEIVTIQTSSYDRTHGYTYGYKRSSKVMTDRPVVPMRLVKRTATDYQFDYVNRYPDGTVTRYVFGQPSNQLLARWGTSEIPSDLVAKAQEVAISRFRGKSVGLKAELAMMLAESRKTASLIAENAYRALAATRALVRGDITGVVRWLGLDAAADTQKWGNRTVAKRILRARNKAAVKDVAGAWLELQYGWKPFLHDCYDAAKLLEQTFAGGRPVARIAGSSTQRYTKDLSNVSPGITTQGGFAASITVRYGGSVGVQDPGSYALQSLGVTNPAALAWELIPYSFVVDWFIPIGNYLEHLNELDGLVLSQGFRVEKRKSLCKSSFVLTRSPYEYSTLTGGNPSAVYTGFVYDVQKVSTFPPDVTNEWPPKVKGWLEGTGSPLTRIANAIALTASAFLRR